MKYFGALVVLSAVIATALAGPVPCECKIANSLWHVTDLDVAEDNVDVTFNMDKYAGESRGVYMPTLAGS